MIKLHTSTAPLMDWDEIVADSLDRGQWLRAELDRLGIPGNRWDPPAAAMLVGSLLLGIPERAPGKLAQEYADRLVNLRLREEAARLLLEFNRALDVYIQEHS